MGRKSSSAPYEGTDEDNEAGGGDTLIMSPGKPMTRLRIRDSGCLGDRQITRDPRSMVRKKGDERDFFKTQSPGTMVGYMLNPMQGAIVMTCSRKR